MCPPVLAQHPCMISCMLVLSLGDPQVFHSDCQAMQEQGKTRSNMMLAACHDECIAHGAKFLPAALSCASLYMYAAANITGCLCACTCEAIYLV